MTNDHVDMSKSRIRRGIMDVSKIVDCFDQILVMHSLSGCDTTSALFGKVSRSS